MIRLINTPPLRRAVTLMEVIFAIGVILIGLLGLVSILPLAGRRAQESVSLSVGAAVGQQVLAELQRQNYLADGRLRPIPATTAATPSNLTYPTQPTPVAPAPVEGSFCLDPMFASSTTPPAMVIANGYTASNFPYYKANHNPLADPSTNLTPWPVAQPRMTRVGVTRVLNPPATPVFLSVPEALEIVEPRDDLLVSRPNDRTLPASFSTENGTVLYAVDPSAYPTALEYGKRIPRGDFSWIVTLNPYPDGRYASLTIVVMRQRLRTFDTPTVTAPPATPEENGTGERLAYVTFETGFKGGAGGTVHLVSNANTVDDIRPDDWIMLSRLVFASPRNRVVHRWYRVVSVNGDAERFTTVFDSSTNTEPTLRCPLPSYGNNVWRRKVTLDGSDWSFGFVGSADHDPSDMTVVADNTFATIVSDVISVTERTVLLSDL